MNKKVVLLSATCLLSSIITIQAYAAEQGWVQQNGKWYWQNSKGENVTDTWKPNGSNKYWLGSDGAMVTNQIIEDGDDVYCVDDSGAMITKQWKEMEDTWGEGMKWYYFEGNGKAVVDGWKAIDGKRYHFTDHCMDTGFLTLEGTEVDSDDDDAWAVGDYWVGEDGARKEEAWIQIVEFNGEDYPNTDELWIWVGSNGRKAIDCVKKINNVRYAFDENGAMVCEWYGSEEPTDATYKYYNNPTGRQESDGWFEAVPSVAQDQEAHDADEKRKFYANKSGTVYKNGIKKIGSARYIFDQYGIMRTGWIVIDSDEKIIELLNDGEEYDDISLDAIRAAKNKGDIIYADKDGKIKTNKGTMEIDGVKYNVMFNSKGIAEHGNKNGTLYDCGIQCKADKDEGYKYQVFEVDGYKYLVNTSGKIQKEGNYHDDDTQWTVTANSAGGYNITTSAYSKD